MSRDDVREALLLLQEPEEASPRFREDLLQRFLEEIGGEEVGAPEEMPAPSRPSRRRWLRLRPIPAVAAGLVIALLGAVLVIFPRSPSAWAALERAREQFRPRPLHATISNDTQAFGPDLETVREIRVVEIWFENETRWREETLSYNLFPEEDGSFAVTDGERLGRYSAQENTFHIQPASEIDNPYLMMSGLAMHDPTQGVWGTSTGIKPTQQFLDENCEVSEDQIAGRAADKLTCKTGLEGDTLREATIWLDRETGLILKLDTFSCGTVEGKRRCGHEAVREVKSIEFDPSFPDGIFDVIAPEGATVRWAGSGPAPAEYQTAPGKEVAATFPIDVPADGGGAEMAFGFGSLWVLTQESYREGELRRIDPLTGKVLATIPIDGDFGNFTIEPTPPPELSREEWERIRRGEAPPDEHPPTFRVQGLAVGEGFVWVGKVAGGRGEEHGDALERIDPKTNKVVGSPIRAGDRIGWIGDLTVAAGAVWMTGFTKWLAKVDPKSLAVTHIELEGETLWALGAGNGPVLGDGSLWVPVLVPNPRDPRDDRFLVRLDPATNSVQAKTSRDIGLGLSDLVFAEGALWFLGGDNRTTWVRRLDPRTNRVVASVAERPAGVDFPRYNALVGGGGYLWATDAIENTVLKIDPRTNELVASIGVGRFPGQIAVGSRSIWVLNVEDRTVSRIDF